jgi:2-aminoethylphosphonate-pyruvate transaminase
VPGMGFVLARRQVLEQAQGRSHSLSLDLYDQWQYMQRTGQWRYTPPTHVLAAFASAIAQYQREGGQPARLARYQRQCQTVLRGLAALGLESFLPDALQAPIIVTVHAPAEAGWNFQVFYEKVKQRGYILYPGKLTEVETFRIGCIGAISEADIEGALAAMAASLFEMGLRKTFY